MRIGLLTEPNPNGHGEPFDSTIRLTRAIEEADCEPVLIDCTQTAAYISEDECTLFQYRDEDGSLDPIEIDAVIPDFDKRSYAGCLALEALTASGVTTTNEARSLELTHDKFLTHLELFRHNIPSPQSLIPVETLPVRLDHMLKTIQPDPKEAITMKHTEGSGGDQVAFPPSRQAAAQTIRLMDIQHKPFFMQEFIKPFGGETRYTDLGIFTIDFKAEASMKRVAQAPDEDDEEQVVEQRANTSVKGNKMEAYEPTPEEEALAIKTARVLGLKVARIDLMHSPRGPLVIEANGIPGFLLEDITGVNLARKIVDFLIAQHQNRDRTTANNGALAEARAS